jgi:transposase
MDAMGSEIKRLQGLTSRYEQEIELLHEQVRLLRAQLYGRKTEQISRPDPTLPLFDEEPVPAVPSQDQEEEIKVPAHNRKKRGRKALPEDLPRVEVIHDITDEEKQCGCGCIKARIGEDVSEQLDIIPAKIQVLRHVRYKYACRQCEGVEDNAAPRWSLRRRPRRLFRKAWQARGLSPRCSCQSLSMRFPFTARRGFSSA